MSEQERQRQLTEPPLPPAMSRRDRLYGLWLRAWLPAEHRIHWYRHRQIHAEVCMCKGTGRLPRRSKS